MVNFLVVAIYAMIAAGFGIAIHAFAGVSGALSTLLSATGFLLCTQTHSAILRASERRKTDRQIATLKKNARSLEQALNDTRAKIEDVKAAVEAQASEQSRKIVSELKMLESLMRDFAQRISAKAKEAAPAAATAPKPQPQGHARGYLETLGQAELLEIIRSSLEENRVDLYLQPIVSLPQRKLRFYEALSRLRSEDGTVIMPSQYMKVAAPAGLMSVVDNLLLFRCVQIVRRLVQKTREIAIFCNISGDTLADAEFFPQFLEYMQHNKDLAGQIVFEFGQAAVLKAAAAGEANLRQLAGMGFALSMDHVETLALDFSRIKSLGFRHIKVRAQTLMQGMINAQAAVAAEDFKKLLERHGLNLIAERVEDEKTVVQLLDYNVDFAQGFLFGEPRALRDDPLKAAEQTRVSAPVIPLRRSA